MSVKLNFLYSFIDFILKITFSEVTLYKLEKYHIKLNILIIIFIQYTQLIYMWTTTKKNAGVVPNHFLYKL